VKTSCRFKRPLRFEEEVEVKLIITEIRDRSITYAFQFWKEEGGRAGKSSCWGSGSSLRPFRSGERDHDSDYDP
jgi:hypothetical protein